MTLNLTPFYPASDTPADHHGARLADGRQNRWYLEPIFHAQYPADIAALYADAMPRIEPGDMETIAQPIDFLAINNYSRGVISGQPDGGYHQIYVEGVEHTDMGWEVYPEGVYDLLLRVHRDYRPAKIYITENGAAFPDVLDHQGQVLDPERIAYLQEYILGAERALREGVPLRGYFAWSLLDNFEWAHGYSKRFGLIYVDYPTLRRIPKGSFHWYQRFISGGTGLAARTA